MTSNAGDNWGSGNLGITLNGAKNEVQGFFEWIYIWYKLYNLEQNYNELLRMEDYHGTLL